MTDVQVELDISCHRFRISAKLGGIFLTIATICIVSQMVLYYYYYHEIYFSIDLLFMPVEFRTVLFSQ